MAGKIFVNYRRDDERAMAARIRDRLAQRFGSANIFMDVDNLMAGQRFDRELEKALAGTDVFLSIIGPRWMELLKFRIDGEERDYVREEIAAALKRGTFIIPVLIERGRLPHRADLPEDLRELVLHQKHDITHERFGRDVEDLIAAIRLGRKAMRAGGAGSGQPIRWRALTAALGALLLGGGVLAYQLGVLLDAPRRQAQGADPNATAEAKRALDAAKSAANKRAEDDAHAKAQAEEAERQRLAMLRLKEDPPRSAEARITAALQHWQLFRQSGNTEAHISNGDLVVKEFIDSCLAQVTSAKLSDLNISASYTRANTVMQGHSWIYIPCRDARSKCVSTDLGSTWLARDCKTTSKVARDARSEFVLSSIPHVDANAIVGRLKN